MVSRSPFQHTLVGKTRKKYMDLTRDLKNMVYEGKRRTHHYWWALFMLRIVTKNIRSLNRDNCLGNQILKYPKTTLPENFHEITLIKFPKLYLYFLSGLFLFRLLFLGHLSIKLRAMPPDNFHLFCLSTRLRGIFWSRVKPPTTKDTC